MTIDEATKELNSGIAGRFLCLDPRDFQAIKLGIEALKAIKQIRTSPLGYVSLPLVGETEEVSHE